MAQHTPGPWSVEADTRTEVDSFSVERTEREYVAGYNIASASGEIVGCEGILPDGEANARLIAAAPEILAVLVAAEAQLVACYGEPPAALDTETAMRQPTRVAAWATIEKARAAIAKAEGRS